MKKALLTITICTLTATSIDAKIISTAKIPANNGYIIFELYEDKSIIPECRGIDASGAIAKLEKNNQVIRYGTGCWNLENNGYITINIKSFSDGLVRSSKIHKSKLLPFQSNTQDWSTKSHHELHQKLSEIGLCNACVDNVVQHIKISKKSQCANLAEDALNGNNISIDKLANFPEYCRWKY